MDTDQQAAERTLDQLNSFLRGELSAVATYRQALSAVGSGVRSTLERCASSHEARAELLRKEVLRRGGAPSDGAGLWGAFATTVEGAAAGLGEKAAIAALEAGEDHGRDDYRRDLDKLDVSARTLIEVDVLPEQLRTHDAMSALKHGAA
jgi:demethoxyubiquinone hydroxylase (CLK1/Coq7/Cat5 family)